MSEKNNTSCSCNCSGCLGLVIFILIITAWIWGLPTTWGKLHLDLFPPGVYLESNETNE